MRGFLLTLLCVLAPCAAVAADLRVEVRNRAGEPVANAVVMVRPAAGAGGRAGRFGPQSVAQKSLQFEPFVLIAPVGGEVSFPNEDKVRHHVYSFSPTKRFELKLYGKGEAPSVRFDKAGVVALGCNIHDSMVAYIRVVDTPFAAKTDAAGKAVIEGLPRGGAAITVWHPYMRSPDNQVAASVNVGDADLSQTFAVEVRTPLIRRGGY